MSPSEARNPALGIQAGTATLRMLGASVYQISDHAPAVTRRGARISVPTPPCRIKTVAITNAKPVQM